MSLKVFLELKEEALKFHNENKCLLKVFRIYKVFLSLILDTIEDLFPHDETILVDIGFCVVD